MRVEPLVFRCKMDGVCELKSENLIGQANSPIGARPQEAARAEKKIILDEFVHVTASTASAQSGGCEDWEAAAIGGGATWPQIGSVGTRASKASDTDPAGSVLSDGKVVEAAQGNFPFSRRDALIQAIKGPIVKTAGEQIARQEAMQPGVIAREAQVRHSRYTFPR